MTQSQTILKLASLLEAGLSVRRARSALQAEIGHLDSAVRTQLDSLLKAAELFGGSVVSILEALAEDLDAQAQMLNHIKRAQVAPRATAKLVTFLPLVMLALAQLFGLNVAGAFFAKPLLCISFAIGAGLLFANHKVISRLVAKIKAQALAEVDGMVELSSVVILLGAGVPVSVVQKQAERPATSELQALVRFATAEGASLLPLLRSASKQKRRQAAHQVELQVERLGIKLLVPIGLLALPALLFLAVIPAIVTLITN